MPDMPDELQAQIDKERATIRSDSFATSLGELASMYRDGELRIRPEFQRYFRWDADRKSKLIESILLGIPIPSIFVAQQENGAWDVIDGLQRLSTVFELMGILRDDQDKARPPLVLTKTKYLPALEGMQWENSPEGKNLSGPQKLYIKRSKLDVQIVLRESSPRTKFELFQRLNTGGTQLFEQEIRNAMLVAANKPFFEWLRRLSQFAPFVACANLSDRLLDEQFDMELVLRFVVFRILDEAGLKSIGDMGDFLTDRMLALSETFEQFKDTEELAFNRTFTLLDEKMGADAFRKYDPAKVKFVGGFLISAYEIVAFGLGFNIDVAAQLTKEQLEQKIQGLWGNPAFISASGSGIRASSRIPKTVPLGRNTLKP